MRRFGMENRDKTLLSRRNLLKGGITLLSGVVLSEHGYARLPAGSVRAQGEPRRLYIGADDHTDYMWTADEAQYRQAFLEMLDYYLDLADATAGEPPEYQSRWNCDGSFWIWTYEKNKTAADFLRLIDRIQTGHISVPLNALCVCLGGAPAEAVLRGAYYPGHIERRYGLRFTLAYTMENQTLPYGLASLWAGSGAKYSWKGICGCATQVPSAGQRDHEIYWWVGPDGSRILMKWYSLMSNQSLGGYAEAYNPSSAVDLLDDKCLSDPGYGYNIGGAFGHGWDDLKVFTDEFVSVAKAKTNAERQVIVSNEQDFFEDFEKTHGAQLPSVSASFGNEWDLYCASMAEVSARVKRAVEKLRAAEALATMVSLKDRAFMDGRQAARDQAWMNLGLYWEHDWTADGPVSRSARRDWQRRIAGEIESYVESLAADAAAALGQLIEKTGTNLRFYAFNPLGWMRSDVADLPFADTDPFHVIDLTTGREVPSQVVTVDGERRLRILASNVPPVGYKVFEVRPGVGQTFADAATVIGNVLENEIYRVTVADRGAITSLIDKARSDREIVRSISGRAANDLGASSGSLQLEHAGPVTVTLLATASDPLSHATRITLLRGSDRISIRNELLQGFSDTHTWGFGFNLDSPDVWHEEVGAIIRAKLTTQGGHYSPRNARYDWLTLNHFADMNDGSAGVTLSNADCYFMRLGSSTVDNLDTTTPQISPLVGGQVDGPGLGIPSQGGDTHFLQRFALRTHGGYDRAAAMRFALEHQNPLVTAPITGGGSYPERSHSLLTISNPDVLLWALKPADDGIEQGIVARVWNLAASRASYTLSWMQGYLEGARHVTHIETAIGDATVVNGKLQDALEPQQLKTFLLVPQQRALTKDAYPFSGEQGTVIRYTLGILGTGNTLSLTDTLPSGASAPYDFDLVGTAVEPDYDAGAHRLTWSDAPAEGQSVIIRYSTTLVSLDPVAMVNVAELSDAGGQSWSVRAIVLANPFMTRLPVILKGS
jgi:alpha-mannosidase